MKFLKQPSLAGYESAGADFDDERIYRYRLWRVWGGGSLTAWRTVLWIMLNPSTADEHVLDPTLRRCQAFSRAWGFDGFEVVNLFALRSTNPKGLPKHAEPIGPKNDVAILTAAELADLIVVGWGNNKFAAARARAVAAELAGHKLFCLGTNDDGSPKHPLYLASATPLQEWGRAA